MASVGAENSCVFCRASWYSTKTFLLSVQTESDFDAKPSVMLLGQYSTGKTTFIKHLLGSSYPGK
jgi:EH domain-containing protein 1